ncbi:MAG: hypothetical protein F6K14_27355 [Symploca sp. SIO2C1]|nr:hypothetical protein [Symploca sp. SIO2C1]
MIQAISNDVLCSGHGSVELGKGETVVPQGIRFVVLAPPAASVANSLASKLESGAVINGLEILSPKTGEKIPTQPIIYDEGKNVPNYILHPIDGSWLKPGVAHIVGVAQATPLAELWPRITIFTIPNKTIDCFWAACTALKGATNPVVIEA